jgi:hypothetical protein
MFLPGGVPGMPSGWHHVGSWDNRGIGFRLVRSLDRARARQTRDFRSGVRTT